MKWLSRFELWIVLLVIAFFGISLLLSSIVHGDWERAHPSVRSSHDAGAIVSLSMRRHTIESTTKTEVDRSTLSLADFLALPEVITSQSHQIGSAHALRESTVLESENGLFVSVREMHVTVKSSDQVIRAGMLMVGRLIVKGDSCIFHSHFPVVVHIPWHIRDAAPIALIHAVSTSRDEDSTVIPIAHMETLVRMATDVNISLLQSLPSSSKWHYQSTPQEGTWQEQTPLGNGELGVLVGGPAHFEILPLSTNDFFVYDANILKAESSNDRKPQPPEERPVLSEGIPSLIRQTEADAKGKIRESLGYFEYLSDVVLLYGSVETSPQAVPTCPSILRGRGVNNRRTLLCKARQAHKWQSSNGKGHSNSTSRVLWSSQTLDLFTGISHSQFLLSAGSSQEVATLASQTNQHSFSSIQFMDREWFVSKSDKVLVGRISCQLLTADNNHLIDHSSCTNVSLFWDRQHRNEHVLNMETSIRPFTFNELPTMSEPMSGVSLTSVVHSRNPTLSPIVAQCMVLLCIGIDSYRPVAHWSAADRTASCSNASQTIILISLAKNNDLLGRDPLFDEARNEQEVHAEHQSLSTRCEQQLQDAARKGIWKLRSTHAHSHAKEMSNVELNIDDSQRLANDPLSNTEFTRAFQLGRYLSLSSSSASSIANLQGIWAEGPVSAWNGDYHLNINTQMLHWASQSAGLNDAVQGFRMFMLALAKAGTQRTADSGDFVQTWKSFGFTDSSLRAEMFADLQWSLCRSCSAWLTTQLFDMLIFDSSRVLSKDVEILKLVRGAVQQALSELWWTDSACHQCNRDNTMTAKTLLTHSLPTTSPENSYRMLNSDSAAAATVAFLAPTPAIDVSVYRELANVFSILTASVAEDMDSQDSFLSDRELAKTFQDAVYHFPNNALPQRRALSGRLAEYPDDCLRNSALTTKESSVEHVDDSFDLSHRHFSHFHWLYPATYLPWAMANSSQSQEHNILWNSARETLKAKIEAGGGHTSWSTTWSAALWARLLDAESALTALQRMITEYSNLGGIRWSLHPALQSRADLPSCVTCYLPKPCEDRNARVSLLDQPRGFRTLCGDVFQLDGNLGLVAAALEMLVQHHTPGTIHLLPALPAQWGASGWLRGLRLRGNALLDIRWQAGEIQSARILLRSRHMWWGGIRESLIRRGFYDLHPIEELQMTIISANPSLIIPPVLPFNQTQCAIARLSNSAVRFGHSLSLEIASDQVFPCLIIVCSSQLPPDSC